MPLQHPLSTRFADLPLILCGPMLRRVEADRISVWVALKAQRDVVLEIYAGYCSPSGAAFPEKQVLFASSQTPTLRIGEHLHLALLSVETNGPITPGSIFSYNLLFFEGAQETENLVSLGLLQSPELLGFKAGQLPSFVAAPEQLEKLRIAHGSCRKPHGRGRDALAILATVMEPDFIEPDRIHDPRSRPHYLFHTGDQIYADDCTDFMIQHYTDAGNYLLQKVEELPFPLNPELDFSKQADQHANYVWIQAISAALPPGRRATNFYSGFTGEEGNHLYSFAEFCAAYLFQWCDVLWLEKYFDDATRQAAFRYIELPAAEAVFKDRINDNSETRPYLFGLVKKGEEQEKEKAEVPAGWDTMSEEERTLALNPSPTDPVLVDALKRYGESREQQSAADAPKSRERVLEFRAGLKAVRRVLANTPSIMSFDDHDITDDWYITGRWSKRVLNNRLGETIIRNGLLAYALFQAWGNDPKAWSDKTPGNDAPGKLLESIPAYVQLFKPLSDEELVNRNKDLAQYAPITAAFRKALGFDESDKPPVKWNCSLRIGAAKVFVLDTRTRRDFSAGQDAPPNLLRKEALIEQIPDNAMPIGTELAFVVSGAPVLGLAVMESIGQPTVSRVLEIKNSFREKFDIGRRKVHHTGSESLDVEHWSIHEAGFEAVLKRCATLKKVVFLAGDVHYGITSEMDYWVKGAPEAARFVQLVSSSLKNIKPEGQMLGLLPAALTQVALAGGLNREFACLTSIGWEKEEEIKALKLRVQTEPGQFADARQGQFPTRYAYALSQKAVSVSLRDWPLQEFQPADPAAPVQILPRIVFKQDCPEPAFRWSMKVLPDERTDAARFAALPAAFPQLAADLPPHVYSGNAYKAGLQTILSRNAFFSRTHINRFVNWYSHVAMIHFEKKEEELSVLHSMFFIPDLPPPDNKNPGSLATPFVQYRASLKKKLLAERPAFPLEGA
ncbi:MAG: hypothetical protein INR73_18740 [Williamsia sp.]|nr:hypothetical protein [Williamsia sp.]